MSIPVPPEPTLFFISILSARWPMCWPWLLERLEERFGPAEEITEEMPFDFTDYYTRELGRPISRRIVVFEKLQPRDGLPEFKLYTNALEQEYAQKGNRVFNLDPGFVTTRNLVLATGKKQYNRIYLRDGIWADLNMIWDQKQWKEFGWTFPDYASDDMKERLTKWRQLYKTKRKHLPK